MKEVLATILLLAPFLAAQSDCDPPTSEPQIIQPDVQFVGEQVDAQTGVRTAVGDLNGDGIADYVINAIEATVDDMDKAGIVYVSYGPLDPGVLSLADSDARIEGLAANNLDGYEITIVGDINNDGTKDLLLGSKLSYDADGAAYLFYGPIYGTLDMNDADVIFSSSPGALGGLGYDVASAGDVNHDGIDDILLSATGGIVDGEHFGGLAFIMLGPLETSEVVLPQDADIVIGGDPDFSSISAAGDVNNDGYYDIILGASCAGIGCGGGAYIFLGPMSSGLYLTENADATYMGEHQELDCQFGDCWPAGDRAGRFVGPAGDMNQDGYDDIYITAAYAPGGGGSGQVYLVYGPMAGEHSLAEADVTFLNEDGINGSFGYNAHSVDLNGDGQLDTLISHTLYAIDGADVGAFFAWYDVSPGEVRQSEADLWLVGSAEYGGIHGVMPIPDRDGDGLPDLMCGNSYNDAESSYLGGAYIINSSTFQ